MTDQEKLAVAAAYASATRAGDAEALAAVTEPEARFWHNFDDEEVGVEKSERLLAWLHRTVTHLTWADVALTPTPSGFVWQAVITGAAPGGALRAHTCMVVTLSGAGRVARVEEYLDPAQMSVLSTS